VNGTAIWTITSQTFADSIRSRWLIVFGAIFFVLATSVTLLNFAADGFDLAAVQAACDSYCPPNFVAQYLSGFVAVVYPYIPLLTLPMGAALIVEERELGTLQYIMSNPISKADFLLGRMLGMLLATEVVVTVGFGVATILVFRNDLGQYPPFATATGAAFVLNGIMLFLAMIVSALTRRKTTAIGISVVIWLLFTVIGTAQTFSVYLNLRAGPWASLPAMVLNPVNTAQDWATLLLGQDITTTGATGLIITHLFHAETGLVLGTILLAWLVMCFAIAFLLFRHQDVV
jgi:Cu-processing system permease protein